MMPRSIGGWVATVSLLTAAAAVQVDLGGLALLCAMPIIAMGAITTIVGHTERANRLFAAAGACVVVGLVLRVVTNWVTVVIADPAVQSAACALLAFGLLVGAIVACVHLASRLVREDKTRRSPPRLSVAERRVVLDPKPLPGRVEVHPHAHTAGDELGLLPGGGDAEG